MQAAADIGHKLKAHLDGLPSGDATNAATVEQALVIGTHPAAWPEHAALPPPFQG